MGEQEQSYPLWRWIIGGIAGLQLFLLLLVRTEVVEMREKVTAIYEIKTDVADLKRRVERLEKTQP